MSGLIDTTTGLRYGSGLIFEKGLGGAGLTNPEQQPDAVLFAGTGSLSALVGQRMVIAATFAGAGAASIAAFDKGKLLILATFAGGGNLSIAATAKLAAKATLPGVGNLSAANT